MRLRTLGATAGLALAMMLPAAPAAAQIETSKPEGAIRQALRDLRIALASDDVDTAVTLYWNDPRLTIVDPDDGFKITGWGEWKQYLHPFDSFALCQRTYIDGDLVFDRERDTAWLGGRRQ
jgi:hypothetical protein